MIGMLGTTEDVSHGLDEVLLPILTLVVFCDELRRMSGLKVESESDEE
jgi:hypothetical protein